METKRTIKQLLAGKENVYFYLPTDESKEQFAKMAGAEGFMTQSKRNAGILKPDNIMSIHSDDNTVYFCGAQARQIMTMKESSDSILRVDFEKYIAGDEDYSFDGKH